MGTYNLRRFSHVGGLKAISREHIVTLLGPYETYFEKRGFRLPVRTSEDLDYDQLVRVLMNPDTETPKGLVDDLFFIHEMATPGNMDIRNSIRRFSGSNAFFALNTCWTSTAH